ncbi:hypothetical protein HER10_EVM0000233 [Colletotrichum scovillei]|uniref:uncharacterized protein n=1 Tax=Colletotrichum scovillei TaxID=1209932 RepID=UPI0015C3196F|nr:uncharacterized protein HER10_EVM0000233 [Colletotrichum scovillei]KAF4780637.1 hypothetical protein HER10_EVM0000233 [Colletotrichum scovillei]
MGSMKSSLVCLGALIVLIIATPIDETSTPAVSARAEATVFMCDDTRFRGHDVPESFIDRISSIRNNDRNKDTCTWYRERQCRGESYRNQDDDNLADGNGHFNDAIRSYECKRK